MGGLGEAQAAGLGAGQEGVEKPRGRATSSSVTMTQSKLAEVVAGQQRVEVLELAQAGAAGAMSIVDVVAGAQQLGARLGHQVGDVAALDADDEHAAARCGRRGASAGGGARAGSAARSWRRSCARSRRPRLPAT